MPSLGIARLRTGWRSTEEKIGATGGRGRAGEGGRMEEREK